MKLVSIMQILMAVIYTFGKSMLDLSTSLNCSAKTAFNPLQIMHSNTDFIDEQRNADMLDSMADIAYEQEQALRESEQSEWDGIEDISAEERNACDHYNERYVYPTSD
jgi:hypothetical protein